jgi:hypothetical protein
MKTLDTDRVKDILMKVVHKLSRKTHIVDSPDHVLIQDAVLHDAIYDIERAISIIECYKLSTISSFTSHEDIVESK